MTKLPFAVVFALGSSLNAWDFRCVGEEATLSYSRDTRPYLEIKGQGFYLEASEKKWEEKGLVLTGTTENTSYTGYSVVLQCKGSFDTFIELLGVEDARKRLEMRCQFTTSYQ